MAPASDAAMRELVASFGGRLTHARSAQEIAAGYQRGLALMLVLVALVLLPVCDPVNLNLCVIPLIPPQSGDSLTRLLCALRPAPCACILSLVALQRALGGCARAQHLSERFQQCWFQQ